MTNGCRKQLMSKRTLFMENKKKKKSRGEWRVGVEGRIEDRANYDPFGTFNDL